MAITVTEKDRKASFGTGADYTTGSMGFAANSEVWVGVGGGEASAFTISANTGGLTFSPLLDIGPVGAFNYRGMIFKATVGSAVGSMTLTVDNVSGGDGYDVGVIEVKADSGAFSLAQAIGQTNGATGEPGTIGTLGSAATTGNTVIMFGMVNEDTTPGVDFAASGWATGSINAWLNQNLAYGVNFLTKSDFTGTSVSITDYATTPSWLLGALIELQEDGGGGGGATPMLRGITRSGVTLR